MVNLTRLMQIILISAVVTLFLSRTPHHHGYRGSYRVVSLISTLGILSDYDLFKKCTRFAPHVFVQYLLQPIMHDLNKGMEYYPYHDIIPQRRRRRQLSRTLRVIRFCMRFSGWRTTSLVILFGQSSQTVNRDCKFIARVIITNLYRKYIHLAKPGTREYAEWLGCGVFRLHFITTIYSIDVVKIKIQKPRINQRDFYDGHHHEHNVGVLVIGNGFGHPCLVSKPSPGRIQDCSILLKVKQYANFERMILANNYIAADRIFRFEEAPILTAYTGIIIENLFGRFKTLFPIFLYWTFPLEWIDLYIQCGMVMLSIILKHQEPLRRV